MLHSCLFAVLQLAMGFGELETSHVCLKACITEYCQTHTATASRGVVCCLTLADLRIHLWLCCTAVAAAAAAAAAFMTCQVSVVSFKKGGLAVRCHAWDRDLGGRRH